MGNLCCTPQGVDRSTAITTHLHEDATNSGPQGEASNACDIPQVPLPALQLPPQPAVPQRVERVNSGVNSRKSAVLDFFSSKHQIVYPIEQVLEHVVLLGLLGEGGFGCVYEGLWRGTVPCAVKVFSSQETDLQLQAVQPVDLMRTAGSAALMSGSAASVHAVELWTGLPAQVLAETILSKDLSHPHIIQTYDVRCGQVTDDFLKAVQAATTQQGKGASPLPAPAPPPTAGTKPGPAAAPVPHMHSMAPTPAARRLAALEQAEADAAAATHMPTPLVAAVNAARAIMDANPKHGNARPSSWQRLLQPGSAQSASGYMGSLSGLTQEERVAAMVHNYKGLTPLAPLVRPQGAAGPVVATASPTPAPAATSPPPQEEAQQVEQAVQALLAGKEDSMGRDPAEAMRKRLGEMPADP